MEEADLDTTLIRINVEIPVNNSFCQYKPAWDFSELFKNRRHVVPCYTARALAPTFIRALVTWPVLFRFSNK